MIGTLEERRRMWDDGGRSRDVDLDPLFRKADRWVGAPLCASAKSWVIDGVRRGWR